jgi:hypothetical protein
MTKSTRAVQNELQQAQSQIINQNRTLQALQKSKHGGMDDDLQCKLVIILNNAITS